ncbi:hypothetical protein FJY63_11870 [Candidatus Sumerlaeota bacterium]|nr:hypothetical protein [Candidatus Sumerlaeota bacterium]
MASNPGVKAGRAAKKAAQAAKTDLSTRIAAGAKAVQGSKVVPDLSGDVKALERKNIATLQSPDAPAFDKDLACRQLALVGTKEAVPALAALAVADDHLCDVACWGLERIPDPAADGALREALRKVKGRQQQKIIQTIANRRDAKAADSLAALMAGGDAEVAAVAARALGKIGGPAATRTLLTALEKAPAAVSPAAIGDGCVALADTLLAEGKANEAASVFRQVRMAKLPKHIRASGLRGEVLARKVDGVGPLIEELRSGDKERVNIAVRLIYEISDNALAALRSKLGDEPKDVPRAALQALKDRKQK